jgi:hypothetical protein
MMTKTQQIIAGLVKHAMHGYPDYQMTDPITPPMPQPSLPSYEPEDQEHPSHFPAAHMISGGMLGAGLGGGWQQQNIMKEMERLKFLRGGAEAGAPSVNMVLLDAVQRGRKAGIDVDLNALRQALTTPQGIEEYYNWASGGQAKDILAKQVAEHKSNLWKSVGKGPVLGTLGGLAAGIGTGYALQNLFDKQSACAERGLLWKEAFKAPPPNPETQLVPDAWREFTMQKMTPGLEGTNPSIPMAKMRAAAKAAPNTGVLAAVRRAAGLIAKKPVPV